MVAAWVSTSFRSVMGRRPNPKPRGHHPFLRSSRLEVVSARGAGRTALRRAHLTIVRAQQGERDRCDHRPDDQSEQAEHLEPAEQRNERE